MAAGLAAVPGNAWSQAEKPELFVYLPSDIKSSALQRMLGTSLPGLTITVFGRFRDFEGALESQQPDALLALGPVLASRSIPPALQGLRGGRDAEPYVLLSTGASVQGSLSGKMIGVVDFLGRKGTQEFVAKLLKTPDLKLKFVTKTEDLLPLLQFAVTDAVLLPSNAVESISARSRLPLRVYQPPDAQVALPAVGLLKPAAKDSILRQFQALSAESNQALGVERWRAR